jgi:hypothetical protein
MSKPKSKRMILIGEKFEECSWCLHNDGLCDERHIDTCDFRKLKYEKKDILFRLEKEGLRISTLKKKIADGDVDSAKELVDVLKGVSIMMKRLEIDFKVKRDVAMKAAGMSDVSFFERLKLIAKIQSLQSERGKD